MKRMIMLLIVLLLSTSLESCSSTTQPNSTPSNMEPENGYSTFSLTTPTNSVTATMRATMTLVPTLDEQSAQRLFLDLLETNGDCQLPCWWGITPGHTSLDEVHSKLNALSQFFIHSHQNDNEGFLQLHVPYEDKIFSTTTIYEGQDNTVRAVFFGIHLKRRTQNDYEEFYEDVFGDPAFTQTVHNYLLPEILDSYGPPSQVLLATYKSGLWGWFNPISILVFYPQLGFSLEYVSDAIYSGDPTDLVRGCPSQGYLYLWLWEPGKYSSISEIPLVYDGQLGEFQISNYLPLSDATNMSIDEFYSTFKGADENKCLETPADLWSLPWE